MHKKSNKLLCLVVILVFSASLVTIPVMAEENIKVVLNGEELVFDVPPQLIDDITMVPVRIIFEALGASVEWDGKNQIISIYPDEGGKIVMQIGNKIISVDIKDQKFIPFDMAPVIMNDRTLVPILAVFECMDADVDWDEETKTVTITK